MADTPICVMCRTRSVDPRWRPFCSERCKLLDLARWADGSYGVPGENPVDDNDNDSDDRKSEV
jgi:uncharacterized protein